jgi:hypothetical protein
MFQRETVLNEIVLKRATTAILTCLGVAAAVAGYVSAWRAYVGEFAGDFGSAAAYASPFLFDFALAEIGLAFSIWWWFFNLYIALKDVLLIDMLFERNYFINGMHGCDICGDVSLRLWIGDTLFALVLVLLAIAAPHLLSHRTQNRGRHTSILLFLWWCVTPLLLAIGG